ncbi:bacteriocin immunity protein [Erwinia billingiae]|uniref:bacteriocin immunity protein n=1 Tax=Erwinia billingiae TaxID=182337 RepID=UPI0021577958|nr:bacteriocin immunity protein [Erwinia billingiae]
MQKHVDELATHFNKIVNQPEGNGLIFIPPDERDDSPGSVIDEIKNRESLKGYLYSKTRNDLYECQTFLALAVCRFSHQSGQVPAFQPADEKRTYQYSLGFIIIT